MQESGDYVHARRLMPTLFEEHTGQLQAMRRSHEINRIENLAVEQVAIVHVRYTKRPDRREFTALITATARDYYVDARDNSFIRGDAAPARFQEFWTFQRHGDRWLLRDVEQSRDSDLLDEENVVETVSEEMLNEIYGDDAARSGHPGWGAAAVRRQSAPQFPRSAATSGTPRMLAARRSPRRLLRGKAPRRSRPRMSCSSTSPRTCASNRKRRRQPVD